MQPLSNDMDHLMRKAAEAYDVPAVGADWDKVAMALNAAEASQKKERDWVQSRRYGLLMLFLLTSLVCNKYLFKPYGSRLPKSVAAEKELVTKNAVAPRVQAIEKDMDGDISLWNKKEKNYPENVPVSFYATGSKLLAIKKIVSNKRTTQFDENANTEKETVANLSLSELPSEIVLENMISKTFPIPFVNAEPTIEEHKDEEITNTDAKRKNGRFYGGVVAGPDFSTIKKEKKSAPGFSAGIIGGYQLNKRWAIETGLLWDRKNYYSRGKYFNTGKMNLPSRTNIIYAEGYCHMIEIPLNLRYYFGNGEKHRWFAAAGASSYLMQKEEYHYLYERYNVQYYGSKNYIAASRNWFSVANLSAGYEYGFKKGLSIRIEPYLKLPLSGLGIGRLPITSTGVQLGVTHSIQ